MVACAIAVLVALAIVTLRLLLNYSRLKSIPGPLLAAFSDLWRFRARRSSTYARRLAELHQHYGKVVRLGTNFVSLCDDEVIGEIYRDRLREELGWCDRHSEGRRLRQRSTGSLESLDMMSQYEGSIDTSVRNIVRAIRRHRVLDVTASLRFFADEFVGKLIVKDRHLGRAQNNAGDNMTALTRSNSSSRSGTSLPTMEELLLRGPVALLKRERISCFSGFPREVPPVTAAYENEPGSTLNQIAMWCAYQETREEGGPSIMANGAESVTTAFVFVFYFLLEHRNVLSRLRSELDTMFRSRGASKVPTWSEIRRLPYLDAVMKESLRLVDHQHEMEVTTTGRSGLSTKLRLPHGTVVGLNSQALHLDTSVYGGDTHFFRPARWLVADTRRRERMEKALLPFSVCVENCAELAATWLEFKKTIVIILREFDVQPLQAGEELAYPLDIPRHPPSMTVNFSSRLP